jgi:tetratricopeptide (TPR) repeat protein
MQDTIGEDSSGKLPWKPRVAGVMALLFGPLAGAFITYTNLRRLGQSRKATLTLRWSIAATLAAMVVLLYLPDQFTRIFGLGVEAAGAAVYPAIQQNDFAVWEQGHPQPQSASGWRSLGLALLGMVTFLGAAIGIGFGQGKLVQMYINRGNQLLDQKRFEEARREYKFAARIGPNDPLPHLGMGDSFADQQRWTDAVREYNAACELKSDDAAVLKICEAMDKVDKR